MKVPSRHGRYQGKAPGRRGRWPRFVSGSSLPQSAFTLSFRRGFDRAAGGDCDRSYPGCRGFFSSLSTNEKAG
jgi:hypothetical protein